MRSLMRRNWTGRRRGCRMGRAMAAICPVDGLAVNQPAVAARAVLDEAPETIGANGSWARVWRRLSMRRGASGAPMLACMDMTCTYSSGGPVGFRVLWWLARKCEQGSLHSVSDGRATMNRPPQTLTQMHREAQHRLLCRPPCLFRRLLARIPSSSSPSTTTLSLSALPSLLAQAPHSILPAPPSPPPPPPSTFLPHPPSASACAFLIRRSAVREPAR